jgi:hypothetical protein
VVSLCLAELSLSRGSYADDISLLVHGQSHAGDLWCTFAIADVYTDQNRD